MKTMNEYKIRRLDKPCPAVYKVGWKAAKEYMRDVFDQVSPAATNKERKKYREMFSVEIANRLFFPKR